MKRRGKGKGEEGRERGENVAPNRCSRGERLEGMGGRRRKGERG